MASNPVINMFKVKELRSRLFFTILVLAIFRLGSVLTIPGIDANVLFKYFNDLASQNKNAFASYMDFFVGGAFSNFSIFMLGVMPYISTQIVMQLAVIIFPSLKRAVQEDGGQRKMATWTRMGTILVCILQSYAVTVYARSIPGCIMLDPIWKFNALAMLTVTTGSMITVWLGDQITARGIGNGISMMIFAGIVARLPNAIIELARKVADGEIQFVFVIVVLLMWVVIIALVIFEEAGERKIPVHYAKRVVGRKMYGGQNTYIPFKINPSNVIPLIFASSLLTLPLQLVSMIGNNQDSARWIAKVSAVLTPNGIWYNVLLVVLIVFFAYFYTQVTLNPVEIAKNIRENGGSIPGVRTDKTEEYLQKILNRLVLPGSLFLAFIAIVPTIIQNLFKFPQSISMLMGGTSLIIMIGVDLDTMSQVEALLKMHHQDGLTKKGKIRSRNL
ncbi:MAG: preprotein translocase subunit SecY [Spirochaetia bacterium]|nr:preprotein translocase subunit SecY [Treponema sp.]MCI6317388.1 preprotein translocase subunit SecY [Spirochaetia bacterium]MCI6365226.1 preprotein translocase subunit SecY [Spirochaetia bacterium]MCI6546592.1 preprotein translocase subunit SecY [Spirochaetia bacterium]MCI7436981.1 preprotein translocase subunit SecY [Spirochaetia bacterium]